MMRPIFLAFAGLALVLILPLLVSAAAYALKGPQTHWRHAETGATGLAPDAETTPEAVVQIYAARAYRWRGIFAVHSWIAIKTEGAARYTRYDVMGWGRPLRENRFAPDGQWFGQEPMLIHDVRGAEAAAMIPALTAAIKAYPYGDYGGYTIWPGPNSNTFVAWVARQVPGLDVRLPPHAVGKDFGPNWLSVMPTPSNTGWQISLRGYAGMAMGWAEGLELHLLGATMGVDLTRPALKLPWLGRLGMAPQPE